LFEIVATGAVCALRRTNRAWNRRAETSTSWLSRLNVIRPLGPTEAGRDKRP